MAGTPNRNTRRPQSGTRRPGQGTRRPQSASRRPASGRRPQNVRRRPARRRYTPIYMRPGFWLFACIVVIIFILIFKGCDGDNKTDTTEQGGAVVLGNTQESAGEPETEAPSVRPSQKPSEKPSEPSEPPSEKPSEKPSDEPTEPSGEDEPVGDQSYGTHRVTPGFYLLGEDLAAGKVTIEVASGSGAIKTSDGSISVQSANTDTEKITGVSFSAGEYLSVTGDLKLTVVYKSEKVNVTLPRPTVNEDGLFAELGVAGEDNEYYVMSEGGDLIPGVYQLQINEGMGVVNVPDPVSGAYVDITVGIYDGYNKIIDYVVLNEGDTVTVKGCTVEFIEMKEG